MVQGQQVAKFYKRKQIESASPGQLVVLLYEAAIDYLNKAELAFGEKGAGKIERIHGNLIACQNIITELTVSLDMEKGADIAKNLFRLYDYMNFRLIDANINKDVAPVKEVRELLSTLKLAWVQVVEKEGSVERESRPNTGLNLKG